MTDDELTTAEQMRLSIVKTALELGIEPATVAGWSWAQVDRCEALDDRRIDAMTAKSQAMRALGDAVRSYFLAGAATMGDVLGAAQMARDEATLAAFGAWVGASREVYDIESQMIWEGYLGESKRTVHLDIGGVPMIEAARQ